MKIKDIDIDKIRPYAGNQKEHPEKQIENIATSIREFGFIQPLVLDKENEIVIGHGRFLAAQKLELKTAPVVYVENLTKEQVRKLRIIDNKLNESSWNVEKLKADLDELDFSEFDISFEDLFETLDEMSGKEEQSIEEGETPPPPAKPKAKPGQIYRLGRHRLMCGDSTSREDVEKLIDGDKIALVLTDPPYGVNIVASEDGESGIVGFGEKGKNKIADCKQYLPIKGDETTDTARLNYEILKDVSENQIIFGGNYFTDFLPPRACWCIWDKENTGNFADAELAWTSFDKGAKLYRWLWNGLCRKGERNVEGKTRVHPTQKPVGMLALIIKDFSKDNDCILDCFGGSGSTLMACEQTNRSCYMIEYEAAYIDVIIKRWEDFTGKKAELISE
jgi:site-specific DNA-methyltransferase (adenine-specific)